MAARVEGPRARAEVVQLCRELCSSHAERAARGDQVDRPLYSESDEVSLKDSQQLGWKGASETHMHDGEDGFQQGGGHLNPGDLPHLDGVKPLGNYEALLNLTGLEHLV